MKQIKEDFIKALTDIGLPEIDAKKIITLFLETIINSLEKKRDVHLVNFGTFKVMKKKKRSFINPKTKKISHIKGDNKVKFIPSRNLIKHINNDENRS